MEFREHPVNYLQEQAVELIYQEETAELIVPDSQPDVQAVADAWAVCCVRDEEASAGSVSVSGAFQAGILCTGEDGGAPFTMDAWMPFTVRLSREAVTRDAVFFADVRIRSVDARLLNSRKLMLRVSYAARLTAYGPATLPIREAEETGGVELLRRTERVTVPVSAAVKNTVVGESVELPAADGEVRVIKAVPELQWTEQSLAENRAVLKGYAALHLVYLSGGRLSCFDVQLPIAQYLELEGDVEGGTLRAWGAVTELSLDPEEDGSYAVTLGLRLAAVVTRTLELPVLADGYCPGRSFTAEYDTFRLRQALDAPTVKKNAEAALSGTVRMLVDTAAWVDFPVCRRAEDAVEAEAAVTLHALYYDEAEQLRGETVKATCSAEFALAAGAVCFADADPCGGCFTSMGGSGSLITCPVTLTARCFGEREVRTMRSAEAGEPLPETADRPSLLVRRIVGEQPLWDIAKAAGASAAAIRAANDLGEAAVCADRLLLIPLA